MFSARKFKYLIDEMKAGSFSHTKPTIFFPSEVNNIHNQTQSDACKEHQSSYEVYQLLIKIFTCELKQQKLDVRVRHVMITEMLSYFPMPISAKAITPAKPCA